MTARALTMNRGGRAHPAAAALVAAALVVVLTTDGGGYYPPAWGWASLIMLAVAATALCLGGVPLAPREWLTLGVFTVWLAVVAVGAARPGAATTGVPELERGSLYLIALWTALVALRMRTATWAVGGILAGIVAVTAHGLLDVLFPGDTPPDAYEGRLLFHPIGYANGMGVLAAVGIVLAIAYAAHGSAVGRACGAAALALLAPAVVLTGSRSAVGALAVALVVLFATDRAAGTVVLALPLPAVAATAAALSHVSDAHAPAAVVAHDGRVVGVAILALASANAALQRQRHLGREVPRPVMCAFAGAAAVAVCAAAPFALADRLPFWVAAWRDAVAHPLLGSGPGSFAGAWLRYRDAPLSALDAHSLYLQTLAELGPLGLAALLAALALPLAALRRARHPFAPAAAAGYVVFLVHAGVDWDWQLPAVTVVALVLAAVVLATARPPEWRPSRIRVPAAAAATALAAVAACAVAVGNGSLAGASRAVAAGDWPRAQQLAVRAARWQPWSAEPLLVLGRAQAGAGDLRAARLSFARAASLAPRDWRPWYDLSVASRGQARRAALAHVTALVR